MLMTENGQYAKKVSIFSCLVQVENDLNIMSLLVINDCVYCDVFKYTNWQNSCASVRSKIQNIIFYVNFD